MQINKVWPSLKERSLAVVLIIAVMVTAVFVALGYGEIMDKGRAQPINEIIRNYGLLIAASWGVVLAVWRSTVAEKQLTQQHKNTLQSDQQHRQSLSQTRFSQAVEHLKDKAVVKRGGIMTLARLIHDEEYPNRQDVLDMLSQFIRLQSPLPDEGVEGNKDIAPLAQTALRMITEKPLDKSLNLEVPDTNLTRAKLNSANLVGAGLYGVILTSADLSGAKLTGADLRCAKLNSANLGGSNLHGANLRSAILTDAILDGADLTDANLTGADLSAASFNGASGLTQVQLDRAFQNPENIVPAMLPNGLTWDENAAKERWEAAHGQTEK